MGLTASDIIIIVVCTLLTLVTIVLIIWEAEKQMYLFGLRPSESTAADMAGLITLTKGLTGDITTTYSNATRGVIYNITIKNKLVCVTAATRYIATDCSSIPFNIDSPLTLTDAAGFRLDVEKKDSEITLYLVEIE